MAHRISTRLAAKTILAAACASLWVAGCGRGTGDKSPEALIQDGWTSLRLEDFAAADADFAEALTKLDRGEAGPVTSQEKPSLRTIAIYGRGMVASLGRRDSAAAKLWFDMVVAKEPGSDLAAWAALAIARDQHLAASADGKTLRAGYAAVIEQYPKTAAAEEAFMYKESLLIETFSPDDAREAIADLDAWLKSDAGLHGHLRTAMYGLLSKAHETLKDYPAALIALIASLDAKENDPANPNQNNMLEYYRIGMMAQYDVGDFATARKYYNRFLQEYPRDQRAFTIHLMLKHMDDTEASLRRGEAPPQLADEGGAR